MMIPDLLRRKVKRAVTDSFGKASVSPGVKPGLANLLRSWRACRETGS